MGVTISPHRQEYVAECYDEYPANLTVWLHLDPSLVLKSS